LCVAVCFEPLDLDEGTRCARRRSRAHRRTGRRSVMPSRIRHGCHPRSATLSRMRTEVVCRTPLAGEEDTLPSGGPSMMPASHSSPYAIVGAAKRDSDSSVIRTTYLIASSRSDRSMHHNLHTEAVSRHRRNVLMCLEGNGSSVVWERRLPVEHRRDPRPLRHTSPPERMASTCPGRRALTLLGAAAQRGVRREMRDRAQPRDSSRAERWQRIDINVTRIYGARLTVISLMRAPATGPQHIAQQRSRRVLPRVAQRIARADARSS
jgi:hypothetical protein